LLLSEKKDVEKDSNIATFYHTKIVFCCVATAASQKRRKKKSKPTAWKHWQIYSYRHHAHICQKHKCSSQCIVIEAIIIFFATNGTIRWTCFSELQLQNDQTNLRKLQQKADTAENIHKK
jgi:hypothetical protein